MNSATKKYDLSKLNTGLWKNSKTEEWEKKALASYKKLSKRAIKKPVNLI